MKLFGILFLLPVFILTSCTIPGSNLNPNQYTTINESISHAEIPSNWSKIVRLTPQSLVKINQEKTNNPYEYRIGPGDVIKVVVWEHPELTNPANSSDANANGSIVRSDGNIFYPYVGLVKASGLTAEELRNTLVKKLAHYIKKPQLDVSILQFNSSPVYVLGAVMRPQVLKLNFKSTSLADALSLSGGINESVANPQGVFVIRKIPGNKKLATRIYQLDLTQAPSLILGEQFKMQAQDVVYVTSAPISLWNRELNNLLPSLNSAQVASAIVG